MKLYISYYGNYLTIVEGIYNTKKDKFNIKNTTFLSIEDIKVDSNDKYALLEEALKINNYKSKNVIFSLNTRDVIIKTNTMPKVSPKDLDGIMNNEMYEMMSLDEEQYTFSYEVTNERVLDDKDVLDIVIGAISNDEIEKILDIFRSFKLNVERIDTMTTAYGRLLNNVEYDDIMMLDIGSYGSIVNIYKQDSLFIHDNIPVRISEQSNYHVSLALVDEVKGLTNFYSSRNFGKTIETIVLVGESNNNTYVKEGFEESFNSKVVIGIEKLFDIENDIHGDLQLNEISKVCNALGSMLIPPNNKKDYAYMNLLPLNIRNSLKRQDKLKNGLIIMPVVVALLASPYAIFGMLEKSTNSKINQAQVRLEEIKLQYKDIEAIDSKIENAEKEIEIYDNLSSKKAKWGNILSSIDKNIPYKVDLTSIDTYYDSSKYENVEEQDQKTNIESNENQQNTETEEGEIQSPVYDQIPNVISIEGISSTPKRIGEFIYSLSKVHYFKSVELISSAEDKENGGHIFNIIIDLEEGAVSGE